MSSPGMPKESLVLAWSSPELSGRLLAATSGSLGPSCGRFGVSWEQLGRLLGSPRALVNILEAPECAKSGPNTSPGAASKKRGVLGAPWGTDEGKPLFERLGVIWGGLLGSS